MLAFSYIVLDLSSLWLKVAGKASVVTVKPLQALHIQITQHLQLKITSFERQLEKMDKLDSSLKRPQLLESLFTLPSCNSHLLQDSTFICKPGSTGIPWPWRKTTGSNRTAGSPGRGLEGNHSVPHRSCMSQIQQWGGRRSLFQRLMITCRKVKRAWLNPEIFPEEQKEGRSSNCVYHVIPSSLAESTGSGA